MRRSPLSRSFVSLGAFLGVALALALAPSMVRADLLVVVHLTTPTAGVTVTVTDQTGARHSCSTDTTGSCEIGGVTAGHATVVTQVGTGAPGARATVLIPSDGKVSLIVPNP